MIIKGSAFVNGYINQCYIGIENGKIDFVKKSLKTTEPVKKFDGVILPGGVDIHVHFREPGMTHKEDFYSGSLSAAFGGITAYAEMPNTKPPTDNVKRLKEKIKLAESKSVVDFAIYGLVNQNAGEMLDYTDLFKVYLSSSTQINSSDFEDGLETVSKNGGKVAFHCEKEDMFGPSGNNLLEHNKEHRPPKSEIEAIKSLSRYPDVNKHVCHISTKEGLSEAKEKGYSTEVTPHHLFLNQEVLLDSLGKVNPPLRDQINQMNMWESYEREEIDILASDHAPHTKEEKKDFEEAPSGIPGVETMYPLLLNSVAVGEVSLSTVVKTLCVNPAKRLGVKKGRIEEGYDADLINIDFRDIEEINVDKLHSKAGWSPFEGFNGIFPRNVISNEELIIDERKFVGKKGRGGYINR
ncbi:MAG: dihydroorotase [Thermoplasmatota archaeon]